MKATEQCLQLLVLMFRLCWKKLFNHLGTEQYLPVYYAVQDDSESVDEILSLAIKMKAIEQYFPEVLFIILYKVVQTFHSVKTLSGVTIEMKANEQNFCVELFITLYTVVLTFYIF